MLPQWYFEQASRYIETLWSGTASLQEVREETARQRMAEYQFMRERFGTSKPLKILTHADLHTDEEDSTTIVKVLTHNEMMQKRVDPSRVSALYANADDERRESQKTVFGVHRFVTKRPRVLQR